MNDVVNHPSHYTDNTYGIECIELTQHMDFCSGNAVKYIWRCGKKENNSKKQDLEKARWYIDRALKANPEMSVVDNDYAQDAFDNMKNTKTLEYYAIEQIVTGNLLEAKDCLDVMIEHCGSK